MTPQEQYIQYLDKEILYASNRVKRFSGADDEDEMSELKYYHGQKVALDFARKQFITIFQTNTDDKK